MPADYNYQPIIDSLRYINAKYNAFVDKTTQDPALTLRKLEEEFLAINKAISEGADPNIVRTLLVVKLPQEFNSTLKDALINYLDLTIALKNPQSTPDTLIALIEQFERVTHDMSWFAKHYESVIIRLNFLQGIGYFNQYQEISKKTKSMEESNNSKPATVAAKKLCEDLGEAATKFLTAHTDPILLPTQQKAFLERCLESIQIAEPSLNGQRSWRMLLAEFANSIMKALGYGDKRAEAERAGKYTFFRPEKPADALVGALKDSLTKAKNK